MTRPAGRGFSLFDAIVLALATAAGVGGMIVESSGLWPGLWERPDLWREPFIASRRVKALVAVFTPLAWAWTTAVFALGLWRPRAESRRLMRRPGLAACAAASTTYAADYLATRSMLAYYLGAMMGWDWLRSKSTKIFSLFADHYVDLHLPGYAVLAAWLVLGMGGRSRGERSWVDRAGRALGLWWLGMSAIHALL